jgi:hypothetical protein
MALNRLWMPSPNNGARSRQPRIIVIHTAEGARTIQSLGSFFANPGSGVSSQTGIDDSPNTVGEYVRRDRAAWTQASFNSDSISTELCAFASWGRDEWLRHPTMLSNTTAWILEECAAAGIPFVRIDAAAAQGSGRGVCGHVDLGSRGGGHWDPGPSFPWDIVMSGSAAGPVPPPVPPGLNAAVVGIERSGDGYVMVASDGGVFNYGAPFHGSAGGIQLNAPVVDLAATDSGYWLAAADGGVFAYDVPMLGRPERLNKPVVGITATHDGNGYWIAAADGGVFNYGAPFHGSAGDQNLNAPIVGIARSGNGYVLAASDGGVFNYGCDFHGSAGATKLNQPIVGITAVEDGSGYYLVAADGGVFCYGSAHFAGSTGSIKLNWPAVGIAADGDGAGYWIGAADGGVFAFDAPFHGSVQDK